MKKFISMVMAAAMVVSMVPATAFAATGEVTAKSVKVVNSLAECSADEKNYILKNVNAQLQRLNF